jgi:putative Mn2+ efflux pump MntP
MARHHFWREFMTWTTIIVTSLFLGVALAMDAFSASIANGLNEPHMKLNKSLAIPGTYAFFQFAMPMLGWVCVHFLAEAFSIIGDYIVPWVAFLLLSFIGGKMIVECVRENKSKKQEQTAMGQQKKGEGVNVQHPQNARVLTPFALFVQGVATSIDALSVGLETAAYSWFQALISSLIIAVLTFMICMAGLIIGKKLGDKFRYAGVLGGVILILIGIKSIIGFILGLYGLSMPF